MKEKRTERKKLERMAKSRSGKRRLVIGIKTPLEIKEALIKGGQGKADSGFHVLLQKDQRKKLNKLASEVDIPAAELLRLLISAATTLGERGVRIFLDAANQADDPKAKFEKAKKRSLKERLNAPEREEDTDDAGEDNESEFETPATGEPTPHLRRKTDRRRKTGAPKPDETTGREL